MLLFRALLSIRYCLVTFFKRGHTHHHDQFYISWSSLLRSDLASVKNLKEKMKRMPLAFDIYDDDFQA